MVRLGAVALRRAAPSALLLGTLASTTLGACTTDHDALARRPSGGGSGGGGGVGGGGFGAGGFGNTGNTAQAGRDNPDDEPAGDSVLTIVNGVVDAPSVRLCFARSDEQGNAELFGTPLPELPYGGSTVLTELDDLSFERDVLVPWVLTGDFSAIDELGCAQAIERALEAEGVPPPEDEEEEPGAGGAGGALSGEGGAGGAAEPMKLEQAPLRARALPGVPAGTVAIGRSVLMALSGCVGGPAGVLGDSICGEGDEPDVPNAPTVSPVIVKVSRSARFDKVGLQGLHAAAAVGTVDLRVLGDGGITTLVFASGIGLGELSPRPADTRFSPAELGVEMAGFGLQAIGQGGAVIAQGTWADVAAASGLEKVETGRSYTAVLLGPQPPRFATGDFNPPRLVVVDNDPTRQ